MKKIVCIVLSILLFIVSGLSQKISLSRDTSKKTSPDTSDQSTPTPAGFTFLNGFNFDFDGKTNSSYVGHINLFADDLIDLNKKRKRSNPTYIGLNAGIMKINYSLTGSQTQTQYLTPNILTRPLDTAAGSPFIRQYNKQTSATKTNTWSYYAQPLLRLYHNERTDIYFHLHLELLAYTVTTDVTVTNLQQVIDTIRQRSRLVYQSINNFPNTAGTNTPFVYNSSVTTISEYFGGGLTFKLKPWSSATLFTQPTIGWALNFKNPIANFDTTGTVIYQVGQPHSFFYLTRFYLKQQLTNNMYAVLGVDIRGNFGNNSAPPFYACYFGIDVGLDGIKKLLQ